MRSRDVSAKRSCGENPNTVEILWTPTGSRTSTTVILPSTHSRRMIDVVGAQGSRTF